MNNFGSFSEDMIPRPGPRPTIAVPPTTPMGFDQPVLTVPELSFLDIHPPAKVIGNMKKPPLPPYNVWKKDNIVNWHQQSPDNPFKPATPPAPKFEATRKQVTFDAPSSPPAPPPSTSTTSSAASLPTASQRNVPALTSNPTKMCSQLELSAYDETLERQRLASTATQMLSRFQEHPKAVPSTAQCDVSPKAVQRVLIGNAEQVSQPGLADLIKLFQEKQVDAQLPLPSAPAPLPTIQDIIQQLLVPQAPKAPPCIRTTEVSKPLGDQQLTEIVRLLATPRQMIPWPGQQRIDQETNQPTLADIYNLLASRNTQIEQPKPPANPRPEPTIHDLLAIVQKQQEQLTALQHQVDHLMSLRDKENVKPADSPVNRPSIPKQTSVCNAKETNSADAMTQETSKQPADWTFYGNTLEQVLDVLQNSPTTQVVQRSAPATTNQRQHLQQVFQVSHQQDVHFGDVNVSATQRLTIGTTETPHLQSNAHKTNAPQPPLTDRSLAMNTLVLKYLPHENQKADPFSGQCDTPPSRVTDMSTHTFNYMAKYDLLQNKRLLTDQ